MKRNLHVKHNEVLDQQSRNVSQDLREANRLISSLQAMIESLKALHQKNEIIVSRLVYNRAYKVKALVKYSVL